MTLQNRRQSASMNTFVSVIKRGHPYRAGFATVACVPKTKRAPRRSKTHFEQVPLKVVEQVVSELTDGPHKRHPANLTVEPPLKKAEPYTAINAPKAGKP
jgi:hypothetical protein